MELKLNLNYKQILKLIYQLPESEKRKLILDINSEVKKNDKNNLQQLILEAPTWNETELWEYEEKRKFINESRLI